MTPTDWLVDAVIVAGVFGFGCLQLTMSVNLLVPDESIRRLLGIEAVVPTAYSLAAVALIAAPLIVRRRFPWPVFVATAILWAFFQMRMSSISLSLVGVLVSLFTLAYERSRNEALAATGAFVAVLFLVPTASSIHALTSLTLVQNIALVVATALAGYALHVHQDYLRAAEERAAEAELTRETEACRRVEAERVRIAREVHDITAHSLSAVSIQAAAAERLIDADPLAAKEAVIAVRRTSKAALEELRAMIGVLRGDENAAATAPTEGTERLPDLVKYLDDAGVVCRLDMGNYEKSTVPAYIDVALFGIAREATTNIVRHAGAKHASITLGMANLASADVAALTVEDDGCGFDYDARQVTGHGLEGMSERMHVLGGTFSAARRPQGGFAIQVTVPLRPREGALS